MADRRTASSDADSDFPGQEPPVEQEGPWDPRPGDRFTHPVRPARRRRTPAERQSRRLGREQLAHRAEFLPPDAATLVRAHVALGLTVEELARIKGIPERTLRRRLARLRARLEDPCFLLAAKFRDQLPTALATLATAHWMEDLPLRQLAHTRGQTLHRVRQDLALARSLLLVAMSNEQAVSPELAAAALEMRRAGGG
jgi:DNA-directed RNA polymerase specialized sigma24 family protein